MPKRILIVDDHEAVLFALWDYLTARRYSVDRAASRTEADRLLANHVYGVVITDLSLTSRDGSESFAVIRAVQERCPTARTILLTTRGTPAIEDEARRHGAHIVLPMPLPLARLASAVSDLMRPKAKAPRSAAGCS